MFWFLLLLLPLPALGATCPACPPNGIWSEWVADTPCLTSCGGCSKISYSRTCLSTQMDNCPCVGQTTTTMTCGTQACNWPRTNASNINCCNNAATVTVRNWVHCAPVIESNSFACCPDTGYFSKWTTWSKVANQAAWRRTRSCLSGGYNCPCKGDSEEITTTCPCRPITVITADTNTCNADPDHKNPWSVRTPLFLSSQCQTMIVIEASSFRNNFYTVREGFYDGSIGWFDTSGTCQQKTITYTDQTVLGSSGQFFKYYLNCNLNTLYFDGEVAGVKMTNVVSFAQYY
uniref:GON domain-containing protein n=1 Tax=Caenorhabditis tropicalis TaxID=1561998 RepID=A0A1I7TNW5_9PELO